VTAGPIGFEAPILASVNWPALALTAAAALAIFRFRLGSLPVLLGCALAGIGYDFFSGMIPA
ncbi:MAG: chromate transporter, partial [Sphingosinicella sp.]